MNLGPDLEIVECRYGRMLIASRDPYVSHSLGEFSEGRFSRVLPVAWAPQVSHEGNTSLYARNSLLTCLRHGV